MTIPPPTNKMNSPDSNKTKPINNQEMTRSAIDYQWVYDELSDPDAAAALLSEGFPTDSRDSSDLASMTMLHYCPQPPTLVLPSAAGMLPSLQTLELELYDDQVSLPDEIGHLAELECLKVEGLEGGWFRGSFFGRLQNLKEVFLSSMMADTMVYPDELWDLPRLERLTIEFYAIQIIPSSIGNLHTLKELHLTDENWDFPPDKILPEEIGNLANLEILEVRSGRSLPTSIGKLHRLTELRVTGADNLRNVPSEIGGLASLEILNLYDTSIHSLPSSIGMLSNLRELYLGYTKNLTSLPEEIGNLVNLEVLELSSSAVQSIPSTIGNLHNLKYLFVGKEEEVGVGFPDWGLTPTLPSTICNLHNLERLDVGYVQNNFLPASLEFLNVEPSPSAVQQNSLGNAILCHCARTIMGAGKNPKLWPFMLNNATRLFMDPNPSNAFPGDCSWYRMEQPDAVYKLLEFCREHFVNAISNRNNP